MTSSQSQAPSRSSSSSSSSSSPSEPDPRRDEQQQQQQRRLRRDQHEPRRKRSRHEHDRFVSALEREGEILLSSPSSSRAWERMARTLGRSEAEVKQYAYRYFCVLQQRPRREGLRPPPPVTDDDDDGEDDDHEGNDHDDHDDRPRSRVVVSSRNALENEWTDEECVLFDALSLRHPDGDERRWERIAAMIPGKTAAQVEERHAFLRDGTCAVASSSSSR